MESRLKHYNSLLQLFQKQIDVLELKVRDLESKNTFLSGKLLEFQWKNDEDVQAKQTVDTENTTKPIHELVKTLEEKNMFLCKKLTEFQFDEASEAKNPMERYLIRRKMALAKNKIQYEADMKKAGITISSEDNGEAEDEID